MRLRLGISTCPNDTFAFHAILAGAIDLRGFELDCELLDVQTLNERLAVGTLDVGKASFHAALHLADRYGVCRSGAALGFAVGPLLLAAQPDRLPAAELRVLCPGAWTTATLLLRAFHPELVRIEQRLFSEIMPALVHGEAELGVVIHEGRLTYECHGLTLVEDLGATWEQTTGAPLPLGGILLRHELGADVHARFHALLRDSLAYAFAHREQTLPTLRRYAQELDEDVLWPYVDLYVNEATVELGHEGERALAALEQLARAHGVIPPATPPLELL